MAIKIAVVSQKGGVGKSSIARLIGREFADNGWLVNIADMDVQQATSYHWFKRRVAIHRSWGDPGKVLLEPECGDWNSKKGRSNGKKSPSLFQTIIGDTRRGPLVKSIAHCIYAESARHTGTDWSRNYVWYPDGRVRRFTPIEVERVQGFPDNWTLPLEIDEKQAKRIDSLRYHAIGNAVTPPVAEWVGTRLAKVMADQDLECIRKRALRSHLTDAGWCPKVASESSHRLPPAD